VQFNATIEFDNQRIEDILREKLTQNGYVVEGDFEWWDTGDIHVNVRPMTFEEKEAAGVETRDPAQVVADEIKESLNALSAETVAGVRDLKRDFEDLRNTVKHLSRPDGSPPQSQDGVRVVGPQDYGLEIEVPDLFREDLDPESDAATSKSRLRRLRAEQESGPQIYNDTQKDSDGFVRLKSPHTND